MTWLRKWSDLFWLTKNKSESTLKDFESNKFMNYLESLDKAFVQIDFPRKINPSISNNSFNEFIELCSASGAEIEGHYLENKQKFLLTYLLQRESRKYKKRSLEQ